MALSIHFDAADRPYRKLYSHFAFTHFGIRGDAIVAFLGGCDVRGDELVDLADRRAGETIVAAQMLHFIVEHFGVPLAEAAWRQRMLVVIAREVLQARLPGVILSRRGDDIYVGGGKLSVSIATVSPTSALIHFGINVDGAGAPVEVCDLRRLGVPPRDLAVAVMERYAAEVDEVKEAIGKVRGVC